MSSLIDVFIFRRSLKIWPNLYFIDFSFFERIYLTNEAKLP